MSELSLEEFLHDFRQEIMADAEAKMDFLEPEFTRTVADDLVDTGVVDGFEPCHFRLPTGGVRVDGYWFNEDTLDLFITDFDDRETVQSLSVTDVKTIFNRVEKFFTQSAEKNFYIKLEETSPSYGLSWQIAERADSISKVNFFLISDRSLSEKLKTLDDKQSDPWIFSYNIWDISRVYRLRTSRGVREELEIDFVEMMGDGLPCLPAHLTTASYRSYLVVMPASVLAELYGKYGSRLLEHNVRSFLQVRGVINKGIRATIIYDPEMFFAYNNGITATARDVEIAQDDHGVVITRMKDFQIVNGGQTTASLLRAQRVDKACLDNIFVQMKLSVIDADKSEEVVPKISEYANTQNKVSTADFFSNHPYHVRMEALSRRLWAPAQQGEQRETKWFYERARGQYQDALSKLTPAEKRRFQAEYPKSQMFTKTDLAKFENVWSKNPVWVHLGAQKNFAHYAREISQEWDKNSDQFNELYFRRAVARAIIFRRTERLVSAQPWYNRGYRANIVAYTLSMLSEISSRHNMAFDFMTVWSRQDLTPATTEAIEITAEVVHDDIMRSGTNISNISEWCKRDACWIRLQTTRTDEVIRLLPEQFFLELISSEDMRDAARDAAATQRIDKGIEAQTAVMRIPAHTWGQILTEAQRKRLFSPTEIDILKIAAKIPEKIPSQKQCIVLLSILEKARLEAIYNE